MCVNYFERAFSGSYTSRDAGDYPLSTDRWQAARDSGNPVLHFPLLVGTLSIFANVPGIGDQVRSCLVIPPVVPPPFVSSAYDRAPNLHLCHAQSVDLMLPIAAAL
jgi:hypothetical protein